MPLELNSRDPGFKEAFAALVAARRGAEPDVDAVVGEILEAVRGRGDAALTEYSWLFDKFALTADNLRVRPEEIEEAAASSPAETVEALDLAWRRILAYHRRQMPQDDEYRDEEGIVLGTRWKPIAAAGLYVPGGTASYPSSVLMNAAPAKVAGVERLVIAVPAPQGRLDPLVLAAAKIAGIGEIYRIGGAQAIAALAYGTESIAPVDKIFGPGNAYVAAAKRRVFGTVGIDMIAGPSEILVVADRDNDPAWIAIDLLSQAEHDPAAQSVLITDDADFAASVIAAAEAHLKTLPRADIAGASWEEHGAVITVETLEAAPPLIDALAPEHLELAVADPETLAARVRNAGAIFLGRFTPEAVGDYVAGPNHVLPTSRSARFSSGLSVYDFLTRTSILRCDAASLGRIGPAAIALARAEGLDAHALSVAIRLNLPR